LLDDSFWPLVRVTFPRHLSPEQSEDLRAAVRSCLRREERHVYLVDLRSLHSLSSEERAQLGAFLRDQAEGMRRWCMGIVALINSPALALMARVLIHHVKPTTVPYSVLASWPASVDWVTERLEANGWREHGHLVRQRLLVAPGERR
jgi:hypothetical protein